jgi:hypothetical protein
MELKPMYDIQTRNELLAIFRKNVKSIETALAALPANTTDCVYVWPKHWLAVKFDRDNNCRAVACDLGTVVSVKAKPMVFTNGNRERAVRMNRELALCGALTQALQTLNNFQAKISA